MLLQLKAHFIVFRLKLLYFSVVVSVVEFLYTDNAPPWSTNQTVWPCQREIFGQVHSINTETPFKPKLKQNKHKHGRKGLAIVRGGHLSTYQAKTANHSTWTLEKKWPPTRKSAVEWSFKLELQLRNSNFHQFLTLCSACGAERAKTTL